MILLHATLDRTLLNFLIFLLLPATKLGKVMFLHVSVILFTGGEYLGRYNPWAGTAPWAGTPPLGRCTPQRGTPPGQVHHPRQVHPTQAGTPPAGTSPWQVPPRQVHPPATVHAGIWSTRGWHASHWNAFLFSIISTEKTTQVSDNKCMSFQFVILS